MVMWLTFVYVLCRHRVWQRVRWLLPHTLPQWLLESGTGLHAHQWHHKVSHHLSSPRYLKLFFSRLIRELTFTLAYHPLTLFKFNLYASMSRDNPWTQLMGGADTSDEDQDTIKVYVMWPGNHMTITWPPCSFDYRPLCWRLTPIC